ncbi:MAG: SDR family oxidoreductase [Bryobacterales bacterium]|nr:SDR family oxidoreductase [Bryobacterales bacterium]
MNLDSRIALVTGATSGIGRAIAVALAGRGAKILAHGRNPEAAAALEREIGCATMLGDIADPEVCAAVVARAWDAFGGLDILIHAAGGPAPGNLLDVSPEAWHRAFDVHVHAVYHLCRHAVPVMKTRGDGAILLISSAAGSRGCLGALAYGVAKGCLPQFARNLARELAPANIRVNSISPGVIRTPFQDFLTPEQVRNNIENRIPLRREGTPADVAAIAVALIENGFITGEDVAIDGGMTMRIA